MVLHSKNYKTTNRGGPSWRDVAYRVTADARIGDISNMEDAMNIKRDEEHRLVERGTFPRPATRPQWLCCAQRPSRQPPPGLALAPVPLRRCPNVHRGAVPAPPSACVARSPSLSRDWSRAWPSRVAHQSLLLSCASPASPALSRALHAASVAPPPPGNAPGHSAPSAPASEAPCAAEAASNSDDDWDALLDAHGLARLPVAVRPPSPSRPTPLELVGARDKRRRRLRKAAKRSMWREI